MKMTKNIEIEVNVCDFCKEEVDSEKRHYKCRSCGKLICISCSNIGKSKYYETGMSSYEFGAEECYCIECREKYKDFFYRVDEYNILLKNKEILESEINRLKPDVFWCDCEN